MLGEFHVTKNALYVESGSINKPLFANQFAANNRCLALRPLTWLPKTRNIKGLVFQVRQRSFRVQIIRAVEFYCEVLRPPTVRAMLRDVGLARTLARRASPMSHMHRDRPTPAIPTAWAPISTQLRFQ